MPTTKDNKLRKLAFFGSIIAAIVGTMITFVMTITREQASQDTEIIVIQSRLNHMEAAQDLNTTARLQIGQVHDQFDLIQQQLISQQQQLVDVWKVIDLHKTATGYPKTVHDNLDRALAQQKKQKRDLKEQQQKQEDKIKKEQQKIDK